MRQSSVLARRLPAAKATTGRILGSEPRTGGSPMRQQPGGLVDDDMCKAARGEDLIHHWAAAARVEYVTFEEKQSHTRTPHRAKQVVEPVAFCPNPLGLLCALP